MKIRRRRCAALLIICLVTFLGGLFTFEVVDRMIGKHVRRLLPVNLRSITGNGDFVGGSECRLTENAASKNGSVRLAIPPAATDIATGQQRIWNDNVNLDNGDNITGRTWSSRLPQSSVIPRVVYFVWCGTSARFTFNHYLTMKSAYHFLNPEKMIFFYKHLPVVDSNNYDTWFDELSTELYILERRPLESMQNACSSYQAQQTLVKQILVTQGGVFVDWTTVLLKNVEFIFEEDVFNYLGVDRAGLLASRVGQSDSALERNKTRTTCQRLRTEDNATTTATYLRDSTCVSVYQLVYPANFWHKTDALSRVVNALLYGTELTPTPEPDARHYVIPNIAHVLWIGGKRVNYMFYLSCLSLLYVAQVDMVLVHGDVEPSGEYWVKIKEEPRLRFVRRILPDVVHGQKAKSLQLISDVFRVDIMLKYGGIYSDVDVIWTQKIDNSFRKYEAVASFDWAHAYYPFPDYINLGVSLGKRGAAFWRKMKESLTDFRPDHFGYNGLLKPYKIYERNPGIVRLERHLQVMCLKQSCYPGWGVKEEDVDWSKDTWAYHWTWPTPAEFRNERALLQSNSTWSSIGQNVLRMKERAIST